MGRRNSLSSSCSLERFDKKLARLFRRLPQGQCLTNLRKLTDLEEKVLLKRVLDLDTRGFQPRLANIREMADRLRVAHDALYVGPR